MSRLTCFKAYDIRGQLGTELNTNIAYRIGRAFGQFLKPKNVVVGGDVRLTSNELKSAVTNGLLDSGVDVIDLGMTGTEEVYFATSFLQTDGGIQVTASHNPMDYNGMKLVRKDSHPISADTGLAEIQRLAEENNFPAVTQRGTYTQKSVQGEYVEHLLSYIDIINSHRKNLLLILGMVRQGILLMPLKHNSKRKQYRLSLLKSITIRMVIFRTVFLIQFFTKIVKIPFKPFYQIRRISVLPLMAISIAVSFLMKRVDSLKAIM